MKKSIHKTLLFSVAAFALLLSACAPAMAPTATQAMMAASATPDSMAKTAAVGMMAASATPDSMAKTAAVGMMAASATPDSMAKTAAVGMMAATATPDSMAKTAAVGMMAETATPGSMMQATSTTDAMMKAAQWPAATLTDVGTGKTFTVADFKGKVVLVETMAQWCPTCKSQEMQLKSLHTALGMPANLITIGLDIDPNENGDTLKTYAATNGFDWIFAVAPASVSREIGNLYGDQFLNPPSAPMLILDQKGVAHALPFGVKSADDLKKVLEPYLNGM